ncbi:MAG: MFS transporter, partial [Caulobacteraceae bacterium]|nr:MFS transporter [Caulobacter sp.]
LAVLTATGVSSLTARLLPPDALSAWGWRVPFGLGAALSLFGVYLRRGLAETPAFAAATPARAGGVGTILRAVAEYPREVFIVFVVQLGGLQYYLWMIFLPTYATLVGGLDRAQAFAGGILASLAYCVGVPLFALASDRIGRKPFLIGSAAGFLVLTYPMLSALAVPNLAFGSYAVVAVAGALLVAVNNAVLGTVFAELFPTRVRASGIGIPYAVSGAIFGGTAPAAATWLQSHGGPLFISLYVGLVCLVTLATHLTLTPETRGRALD